MCNPLASASHSDGIVDMHQHKKLIIHYYNTSIYKILCCKNLRGRKIIVSDNLEIKKQMHRDILMNSITSSTSNFYEIKNT